MIVGRGEWIKNNEDTEEPEKVDKDKEANEFMNDRDENNNDPREKNRNKITNGRVSRKPAKKRSFCEVEDETIRPEKWLKMEQKSDETWEVLAARRELCELRKLALAKISENASSMAWDDLLNF